MKAICWAYTEDDRVCRKPATILDPQRGFMVCQEHAMNREQDTNIQTENDIMSTMKTKNPPTGAETNNEPRTYRTNPETEAKIDNWISENPKDWDYIKAMPIDRLRRTLVLNDVRRLEAKQRIDGEIMSEINNDPTRRQAYDILTKDMPEEQREEFILNAEREKRRNKQQQSQSRTQTQTRREGVGVGV